MAAVAPPSVSDNVPGLTPIDVSTGMVTSSAGATIRPSYFCTGASSAVIFDADRSGARSWLTGSGTAGPGVCRLLPSMETALPPTATPVNVIDAEGVTVPSVSKVSVATLVISAMERGPTVKPCRSLVAVATTLPSAFTPTDEVDVASAALPDRPDCRPAVAVAVLPDASLCALI
jgi:hypothetical protein